MFLNALSAEEKPKFLNLLYIIAKADGNIDGAEIAQIGAYAQEMGIENRDEANTFEAIIEFFKSKSETVKKIVFAEAIALAHADGVYDLSEKNMLKTMIEEFSLPKNFDKEIIEWVNSISPLYAKGFQLVGLI